MPRQERAMEQQVNQLATTEPGIWKSDTVCITNTLYADCGGMWVLLVWAGAADPAATFHFKCSVPNGGSIGRRTVPQVQ